MTADHLALERGTIFFGNACPYERVEARDIVIACGRLVGSDNFESAIQIDYTKKGARKGAGLRFTHHKVVILEGWGHPAPPGIWGEGARTFPVKDEATGITATATVSRNVMGDRGWDSAFNAFMDGYLASGAAKVAADYRDHDYKEILSPYDSRRLTKEMPVIIIGVKDGQILPGHLVARDDAPSQEFVNFAEAQAAFPELSWEPRSSARPHRFVGPQTHGTPGSLKACFSTVDH